MEKIIGDLCSDSSNRCTWGQWKQAFGHAGLEILEDESGFYDDKELSSGEAAEAVRRCKCEPVPEPDLPMPVDVVPAPKPVAKVIGPNQWRKEFQKILNVPPVGEYLGTEDGSPIKIEIECYSGKKPFMFTRAYVPQVVGGQLGWFAQRECDVSQYGWKVILMPKSRDEAVKRIGIDKPYGLVGTIRVLKMSETGQSMLGEVIAW